MTLLVDKSVLARMHQPSVRAVVEPLLRDRALFTCGVIELEVLFSARSGADWRQQREDRALAFRWAETRDAALLRAIDMQGALAGQGQHRGVPLPDLVVAAVAEDHGLGVLHYDRDFDRIAAVSNQSVRWVVEAGSID